MRALHPVNISDSLCPKEEWDTNQLVPCQGGWRPQLQLTLSEVQQRDSIAGRDLAPLDKPQPSQTVVVFIIDKAQVQIVTILRVIKCHKFKIRDKCNKYNKNNNKSPQSILEPPGRRTCKL